MEEELTFDPGEEIASLLEQKKAIDARLQTLKAMVTGYKRCSRCKKWKRKTPELFSSNGKGGLRSTCKACESEAGLLRREQYRKAPLQVYEKDATAYCSSHHNGAGAWLPVSHFSRNRSMKRGLANQCKACKSGYAH